MSDPAASSALAALRALDDEEMAGLLGDAVALVGGDLEQVERRSVHERAGRSLSRVYDAVLRVGDALEQAILVAHADARGYPEGSLVLERDRVGVAVWRHPHDPYLPGLASAMSPERVRELLDRLGVPDGAIRLRSRAYRPSRRGVVEVLVDTDVAVGRVLYLKVLDARRVERIAEVHRALAGALPVPRVVGTSPRQGILAMEALPGRTLRGAVVEQAPLPSAGEIVAISDTLAASGLETRADPRRFADPRRHVPLLTSLVPERALEIELMADEAALVDGVPEPVHGDLHDGQILVDDHGRVSGLLDVDGVGVGLLAHDAGALVAHVAAIALARPRVRDHALAYAGELADAYRSRVGADALHRAVSGAWIGMATGPHRAQVTDWRDRTHERLDRAAAALCGALAG
jgi:aminoglycoside phosphotransferase